VRCFWDVRCESDFFGQERFRDQAKEHSRSFQIIVPREVSWPARKNSRRFQAMERYSGKELAYKLFGYCTLYTVHHPPTLNYTPGVQGKRSFQKFPDHSAKRGIETIQKNILEHSRPWTDVQEKNWFTNCLQTVCHNYPLMKNASHTECTHSMRRTIDN
jgi:hypothetical protein